MSTATRQVQGTPTRLTIFAVSGAALSAVFTAFGTFKGHTQPGDQQVWLFINLPIVVAATILVFAVIVRRALLDTGPERAARTGLVLSLLAVASTVFANFGLNAVLASGAVCCAFAARQRTGRWSAVPGVAVALSVTAVALAAVFALIG